MIILIKSVNVVTSKTNKGTTIVRQQAAIDQGRDFPLVFELVVDKPYQPGQYRLDENAYRVNQYGSLELDPYNLKLVPLNKS